MSVDGYFSFNNRAYKAEKGLIGEYISLTQTPLGWRVGYAGVDLAYLHQLPQAT